MADTTISGLAAFQTITTTCLLVGVDVNDHTMAGSGTDKNLTCAQLFGVLTGDATVSGFAVTVAAGAITSAKLAAGAAAANVGALGGDLSGTLPDPAVARVNGVSYPASPATGTVPVVTSAGQVTYEAVPNSALASSTITLSGHVLSLGGSLSLAAGDVGLGNVTDDTQTKAAVVPNTSPSAGQLLVGAPGGAAYAPRTVSGDGTLSSGGALAVTSTNGTAFAPSATVDATNAANITSGTLPNARLSAVPNSALADASVTIATAAPLAGGGAVALGGTLTLSAATFGASGPGHSAGTVPDPGGTAGSTRYLREDATWATPTGGGGSPGGSSGQVQFNNSGSFGGAANLTVGSAGQLNFASQAAPGSPAVGDEWYDSTQTCRAYYDGPGGLVAYRLGLIYSQVTDVTVTASGSLSLVSTTSAIGTVSLPAGFLNIAGRSLRLSARGYYSTAASSPGTVAFAVKLGSSVIATTIAATLQASQSAQGWTADVTVTTKATGTSGKLDTGGNVSLRYTSGFPDPYLSVLNGTTAGSPTPATQVPLDLTQAYTLDFQVAFSVTTDSITLTNLTLEVLG